MSETVEDNRQVVKPVHSFVNIDSDPDFELGLSRHLLATYGLEGLREIYPRFATGDGHLDSLMRKAIWRAGARSFGHGVTIASGAGFRNLQTFEIGDNVLIGPQAFIMGYGNGKCRIGNNVWIGPQAYLDARDLLIEDYVGCGAGAKILGSVHTGLPAGVPIIQTDLEITPVTVEAWADIGVNTVILPGITVGMGSQVGAGTVVTRHVPPFAVVAGVPARFIRWRAGYEDEKVRDRARESAAERKG